MGGDAYYKYQAQARGFDSAADVEAAVDTMARAYGRLLSRWLPAQPHAEIYEVACGPGIMLRYLKRSGYINISGSDSSACQIALARAAKLDVEQRDSLQDLAQHRDERWNCLLAIDFIEHLPKDVLIDFFSLSHRKL